jgi:putative hydrolase of the HAD superfamily
MAITTIVFDFGNVIGFFDHRRAARQLTAHTGVPEEAFLALLHNQELEDAYESGRLTSAEFLQRVRQATGVDCPDAMLGSAYSDIFWPNDAVCSLVPRLRTGYRLLLGSNTTELHAQRFRHEFRDTLQHFAHLVLSFEIGVRKPRPGFFQHCQRQAGVPATECLFIDDLPANVEGARACGWHGIVYRDPADLRGCLADLGVTISG